MPPVPSIPLDSEFRHIVEQAPTMMWRSGLDSRRDYVNGAWLKFTGRTLEQELGDGWTEGIHPDDLPTCSDTYLDHFRRRAPFEICYRLRRHDGCYRSVLDRAAPFHDEHGRFAGFIGSCVDVDERRRADETKAGFLSTLSHDFRTPLTSMRAYVEVIRRKLRRGEAVHDDVFTRLGSQIDRCTRLVDDLGDAGRMEQARELAMTMGPVDLGSVAREAIEVVNANLERGAGNGRDYAIALEIAAGAYPMTGDRRRLDQVVANLLDNALKFSPAGGTIRVGLETNGGEHTLVVADAGIGIPADEISAVVRPYYRASNAFAGHYPGIGLGLAIGHELVVRHGGSLTIDSRLGAGTTVTVRVPARTS